MKKIESFNLTVWVNALAVLTSLVIYFLGVWYAKSFWEVAVLFFLLRISVNTWGEIL